MTYQIWAHTALLRTQSPCMQKRQVPATLRFLMSQTFDSDQVGLLSRFPLPQNPTPQPSYPRGSDDITFGFCVVFSQCMIDAQYRENENETALFQFVPKLLRFFLALLHAFSSHSLLGWRLQIGEQYCAPTDINKDAPLHSTNRRDLAPNSTPVLILKV